MLCDLRTWDRNARSRNRGARFPTTANGWHRSWFWSWLLVVGLALLVTGCRVLEYREIQRDFDQAVRTDNAGTPFSRMHEDVVERLTTNYISRLDPKLRPNAWMLRAVSAWRAGLAKLAEDSAQNGRKEPALVPGSRDDVVLAMIPALVVDSELQRDWLGAKRVVTAEAYAQYQKGFRAALNQFSEEAEAHFNEKTPTDALAYYRYQRWRLIQNWAAVISSVTPTTARVEAQDKATQFLGTRDLIEAANAERDKIPGDHPLRALIRAQGGQ
jgi:hypothetical protein